MDGLKTNLCSINVKNYDFSVITMFTEFQKLSSEIKDLGGSYVEDEKSLDFWIVVKTMKEI